MLLLNEKEMDVNLKNVLLKVLTQLKEVNNIVRAEKCQENAVLQELFKFSEIILNNEKPLFFLETYFSSATNKYNSDKINSLASVLSLSLAEIKIIEDAYMIKYPKKLNINKKDNELLKEILILSNTQTDEFSIPLKELNKLNNGTAVNVVNYYFNKTKEKDSFQKFAKKLQSQFIGGSKLSMEHYNKFFNLSSIVLDMNSVDKISGLVVFNKELNKSSENYISKIIHTDNYQQVSIAEVLKQGVSLNLNEANKYHYFTQNNNIFYAVEKNQVILDAQSSMKNDFYVKKNIYGSQENMSFLINEDTLNGSNTNNKALDYLSIQKIRTAVLKPQKKWAPGCIMKIEDALFYIGSYPKVHSINEFVFTAIVVTPEYLGEYFLKNDLIINKKNIDKWSVADKMDSILFYESVNSSFQYHNANDSNIEIRKKYGNR